MLHAYSNVGLKDVTYVTLVVQEQVARRGTLRVRNEPAVITGKYKVNLVIL